MSLSRILNKTPMKNEQSNIYEYNDHLSKLIQSVIQGRFISEGIYTFEQLSMPEYNERYVISPSFDKMDLNQSEKNWTFENIKELTLYELEFTKKFFLPFDTRQFIDLFEYIVNIPHVSILTQFLLCKRQDNWREIAISLYKHYLKGIDNPSNSKLFLNIQNKVVNILGKMGDYQLERERIDEIENKITQNVYRIECRFVLFEKRYKDIFENSLESHLNKMKLFNQFKLAKVVDKKEFIKSIQDRSFQYDSINQLLSEQEIYSLLCDKEIFSSSHGTETNKSLKVKSIPHIINTIQSNSPVKSLEENILIQNAIKFMPKSENKEKHVDQKIVARVNQSLKRVGIVKNDLKVNEIHQGASLQKIQLVIPPEITYTSIKKKLEDIQGAMGNKNITIEIGDKPDTINIHVPLDERDVVYLRDILNSNEFNEFRKNHPLPFIIGDSVNGEYMFGCLSKFRHLLIAGTSGSGKSVFLTLILICLLLSVPPDEIIMYLIDPKMVELTMFNGFPQVKPIITDMKKATDLLQKLCIEMDKRYEIMSKAGVKEISIYNKKNEIKMPYIVACVDEFADLIMVNSSVEDYIVRIAQKGRACGIHLIIATQRPSVDVVTGLIKANMPTRFAFKTTSGTDSKTILDTVGAEKLLGIGDGLAKIEGSKIELERFQAPVLTLVKDDEEEIYQNIKDLFEDVEIDEAELSDTEEPIDQLKRIIANTGELRVSELQTEMGIAIGKVTDLLKQLVEEEWLTKDGRKYVINVDEEELNKWRDN